MALCFVAVMGISLAGYIAVCSRAMNLSNRTFQANLSKQLAEVGVDEALRAFNKNDWADWSNSGTAADWTVSGTTATCNLTFPSGKFGQGVTGSVKIRVDNYNATQLNSAWSDSVSYVVNDLIGYNGIWYRCIKAHSNISPPNWNYWVPEGIPWTWDSATSYAAEDLIVYSGVWYRCLIANTNKVPPSNATEWKALVAIYTSMPAWPYVSSGQEALVFDGASIASLTFQNYGSGEVYSWRWSFGQAYAYNDVVYDNTGTWYRCILAHTSDWWPNQLATTNGRWEKLVTSWEWSASASYKLGNVVYYTSAGKWYRCIKVPNTGQTPSDASAYWSNTPLLPIEWDSIKKYSLNDTVRYNGVWYISIHNGTFNIAQNPATATSYWIGANTSTTSYQWSATTAYSVGDYKCYGGVWYKCTTANTGQSPNNTSYWTAAWAQGSGVTTGAPVVYAEGTIAITGNPSIRTQLRAPIAPDPLFPNALGATTLISLPTAATVDSYDSTMGTYNQTTTPFSAGSPNLGSAAVLAGGLTTSTAVTVTSARVNGYVAAPSASTAPFAPRWSYGGTAILTNVASPTVPSPRVDLTRVSRSPNIPQHDIQSVVGGTALSVTAPVTIGTPGATTPSIYSVSGDLYLDSASEILTIAGPVIINITGRLYVTSPGKITIATTGSAEFHFAGQLYIGSMDQVSGIQNLTLDPKKCILIGTSTGNTAGSHYYWAQSPFYGVIYMPNAYLSTWTNVPIYGAVSAKNIAFPQSGGALHYDTSLRYTTISGVDQPYTVNEWRELPQTEKATMP